MYFLNLIILFTICAVKYGNGLSVDTNFLPSNETKFEVNGPVPLLKNPVYQGYLHFENSLYKYHRDIQKWADARKICDAEGGHLVVINSEDEAFFVRALMSKYPSHMLNDVTHKDQVLMGMHDFFKEGEFVTIDGKSLERSGYTYWEPGQPNNLPNQNCGSITRTGGLNDFPCDIRSPFVCEIPVQSFCNPNLNTNG